jgi:hypothetical protein
VRGQIGTTKGTGGDILILEEAAYVDPNFFYETVAPLLIVGMTTLIGISTLTSEINFYTRLFKIRDAITGAPIFLSISVELSCQHCKDEGKAAECKHLLHLVPRWQSSARHERLKTIMSDRPDLIQSELSGLAFDALQQCFRSSDIENMMNMEPPAIPWRTKVFIIIDPAAGGPQSDFAIVSMIRDKGLITVIRPPLSHTATPSFSLAPKVEFLHFVNEVDTCPLLVAHPLVDRVVAEGPDEDADFGWGWFHDNLVLSVVERGRKWRVT